MLVNNDENLIQLYMLIHVIIKLIVGFQTSKSLAAKWCVISCVPQLAEFLIFYHRPSNIASFLDLTSRSYFWSCSAPTSICICHFPLVYVYVAPTQDTHLNLLRLLHFVNLPHFRTFPAPALLATFAGDKIVTIAKICTHFQGRQILEVLNCRHNRVLINDYYYYLL